jgi:hypothetical protein
MKKKAKNGGVFDEIIENPKGPKVGPIKKPKITESQPPVEEVPPPFNDVSAAPSIAEVDAVEKEVKPAPIKKRTLNLMNEARRNDLIDKGFVSGSTGEEGSTLENKQLGHKKLNLNNLNGTLDLGQNRLNLNIGGSF